MLDKLPDDVILIIYSYLDDPSIISLYQITKYFYSFYKQSSICFQKTDLFRLPLSIKIGSDESKKINQHVRSIINIDIDREYLRHKIKTLVVDPTDIRNYRWLSLLNAKMAIDYADFFAKLPKLQEIIINHDIIFNEIIPTIKKITARAIVFNKIVDLKKFVITYSKDMIFFKYTGHKINPNVNPNIIEHLELRFDHYLIPDLSQMHKLTHLDIRFLPADYVLRLPQSLKKLDCYNCCGILPPNIEDLTISISETTPREACDDLVQLSCCHKLKNLKINVDTYCYICLENSSVIKVSIVFLSDTCKFSKFNFPNAKSLTFSLSHFKNNELLTNNIINQYHKLDELSILRKPETQITLIDARNVLIKNVHCDSAINIITAHLSQIHYAGESNLIASIYGDHDSSKINLSPTTENLVLSSKKKINYDFDLPHLKYLQLSFLDNKINFKKLPSKKLILLFLNNSSHLDVSEVICETLVMISYRNTTFKGRLPKMYTHLTLINTYLKQYMIHPLLQTLKLLRGSCVSDRYDLLNVKKLSYHQRIDLNLLIVNNTCEKKLESV